jgi:hypothetical protein
MSWAKVNAVKQNPTAAKVRVRAVNVIVSTFESLGCNDFKKLS